MLAKIQKEKADKEEEKNKYSYSPQGNETDKRDLETWYSDDNIWILNHHLFIACVDIDAGKKTRIKAKRPDYYRKPVDIR